MSKYICVANCPELDQDNLEHCIINSDEEYNKAKCNYSYCPCGNVENFVEVDSKENNIN